MPAPYSYDLRKKVINAIDNGMSKTKVSYIFQISRNTINLWLNRRSETGVTRAKVGSQPGSNPKVDNLEQFKQFAQIHGSKTQEEMAQAWPEEISDLAPEPRPRCALLVKH